MPVSRHSSPPRLNGLRFPKLRPFSFGPLHSRLGISGDPGNYHGVPRMMLHGHKPYLRLQLAPGAFSLSAEEASGSGLSLAAVARPLTSPLPYQFSADRGRRSQNTGMCAVPCRREAALGSRRPRSGGRLVVVPGPSRRFFPQFRKLVNFKRVPIPRINRGRPTMEGYRRVAAERGRQLRRPYSSFSE